MLCSTQIGTSIKAQCIRKLTLIGRNLLLGTCQGNTSLLTTSRLFASSFKPKMTRKSKNKNKGQGQANQGNAPPKQNKKKQDFRAPSNINIVVLGTGGPGTFHSLLVTTEYKRYMFNCGIGTQRLVSMNDELRATALAKLSGLENIFVTHKSWENIGGLLGLTMALEGQKNPGSRSYVQTDSQQPQSTDSSAEIYIHGPKGVEKAALMAKRFAVSANLNIVKRDREFSDECLKVSPVPFYKDNVSATAESEPQAKRQKVDPSSIPETSVAFAYICQPKSYPGKINVEKCVDAGITIGPMVGELQKGRSVRLPDGTVVTPEQVTDDLNLEKRSFLVVECPSLEFLPSLTKCHDITSRMSEPGEKSFVLVAHMTPLEVYSSPEYQAWMHRFSATTSHLVMNRQAAEADLVRVRVHQAMLSLVSRQVFPVLPENTSTVTPHDSCTEGSTVFASSGIHFVYRGKNLGFQWATDTMNYEEIQQGCLKIPGLSQQLSALAEGEEKQTSCSGEEETEDDGVDNDGVRSYPKVVFLGTGSSEPNKIRAQSCIVVQLSKHSVVILDCGEDSYGQLHRFYGNQKALRMLCKVKAIFISHLHGDHHMGLFTLLKEREKAFAARGVQYSPVLLMAPIQIKRWLHFFHSELESVAHLFRFVKHQQHLKDFQSDVKFNSATYDDVKTELSLEQYQPVDVMHCKNAYGLVLKHTNGFKVVYSGDTRPCDALIKAGADCDLLIHEATHEDALLAHAKASKHSTFSEAMDVGAKMRAKYTILTHFSQRYPHMVPLIDMVLPRNVGLAFDNMLVTPSTLPKLSGLIPALSTLFADKMGRFEVQAIKRSREEAEREEAEGQPKQMKSGGDSS